MLLNDSRPVRHNTNKKKKKGKELTEMMQVLQDIKNIDECDQPEELPQTYSELDVSSKTCVYELQLLSLLNYYSVKKPL